VRVRLQLIALCCIFTPYIARADSFSSTLSVTPNRCIALQQGQSCFATLKFHWTTPPSGEFCLFDERRKDPLVCWIGNSITTHVQTFESDKNVGYDIRLKSNNESLADVLVKISWVYKSNNSSTSRWRLF